jgi:DNA-binding transcriptional ArsR family regulator
LPLTPLTGTIGRRSLIRQRPATAGELADLLPIARPSRHLRALREAGLVDVRPETQRRGYSLRPEALVEVDEWPGGSPSSTATSVLAAP